MDNLRAVEVEAGTNWFRLGVVAVAAIAIIALGLEGYAWYQRQHALPPPIAETPPAPPTAPVAEEAPAHPLEAVVPPVALTRENGDAELLAELARLTGSVNVAHWFRPGELIRHVVATVDALPRRQVPQQVVPTTPVPGHLVVTPSGDGQVIAADNAKRYQPWVHLLLSTDPATAASAYRRFYPLLQQAYRDLGYPKGFFNDRLVEAIDDVLQAPQPAPPLRVESPAVAWRFVDPDLESLSAGQKILLRLGPVQGKAVRAWLKDFRARIA
jgi:hypothetical protein